MRRQYWEAMEHHLVSSTETGRKILVLSGMGGSGKTQMVSYFVQQHHARYAIHSSVRLKLMHSSYQHVVFVDTTSPSSIRSDLQSFIRSLGVGYEQRTFEDALFLLSGGPHEGNWLLIFDNADNPELNLVRYLPEGFHGSILITTRNSELGTLSNTVHLRLGPMNDTEAFETLMKAAGRTLPLSDAERSSIEELMKELGNLAVALVQAGRYCNQMSTGAAGGTGNFTFGQYLSLFQKHRPELMKQNTVSLDRYGKGAYTTFNLSYSLLPQSVRELLHLSGFFHYAEIATSMLESAANSDFSDYEEYLARPQAHGMIKKRLRELLYSAGEWDEIHFHDIIRSLQSFSLVTTTSTSSTIFLRFHSLVHTWSRDLLDPQDAESYRQMATLVVVSCTSPSDLTLYQYLLPHITVLMEKRSIGEMHVNDQIGYGRVFLERGLYTRAETLLMAALDILISQLGNEDLNVVRARSILAQIYRGQAKFKEARKLGSEVLTLRQKLLGNEHLETLNAAHSLAEIYNCLGKWNTAEKLELEVQEQRRKLLGNEHPDTILVASSLSFTYWRQSRAREAIKLMKEVLELTQRVQGKDHPDTLVAAATLAKALVYAAPWNVKEAEKMQIEILEQRQGIHGQDHPDTIDVMHDLTMTYGLRWKWREAAKLQVETVEIAKRILGADHPSTLLYKRALYGIRFWKGVDSAIHFYRRLGLSSLSRDGRDASS